MFSRWNSSPSFLTINENHIAKLKTLRESIGSECVSGRRKIAMALISQSWIPRISVLVWKHERDAEEAREREKPNQLIEYDVIYWPTMSMRKDWYVIIARTCLNTHQHIDCVKICRLSLVAEQCCGCDQTWWIQQHSTLMPLWAFCRRHFGLWLWLKENAKPISLAPSNIRAKRSRPYIFVPQTDTIVTWNSAMAPLCISVYFSFCIRI